MARRLPLHRREEEEQPVSPDVGRLIVLGFVIAAFLGLVIGAMWIGWSLFRIHVLGWGA
jgi:uncharacterized protein involved in exopolysaccharide biosynthesis